MGDDETATIRTLTAHGEVFSQYIEQHDIHNFNASP